MLTARCFENVPSQVSVRRRLVFSRGDQPRHYFTIAVCVHFKLRVQTYVKEQTMNHSHNHKKLENEISEPDTPQNSISNNAYDQYKQARLDGHSIARAQLEIKLESGIPLKEAVRQELMLEPAVAAPWHLSPLAQAACRDGMRLAVLELFWQRSAED